MSNQQPFGQSRFSHLLSDQLPQFSTNSVDNDHSRSYSNATRFPAGLNGNSLDPSHQTRSMITRNPSDFALSAYQSAEQVTGKSLKPPPQRLPAQAIDLKKFKGFKFVVLDAMVIETRDIYDEISGTFQWETCENNSERCVKLIQEYTDRRIFLIASGSLGRQVVPIIHDLPQVYAIYIHCADVQSNQQWALQYCRVRIVCNDDDKYLLPLFAADVAQANIEWGDALLRDGKKDKAKEKYNKALRNLTSYAHSQDPQSINEVNDKLNDCR